MSDGSIKEIVLSDLQFRDFVVRTLSRLETNMASLVGPDGTNGRMSTVEERLTSLETSRTKGRAIMWVLGILWTALLTFFGVTRH